MKERVILKDFTVLLLCPSHKWSTIERRVLFDSTFLRNMGCNPIILCFKGSQLDIEAEKEDIPRFFISSKMSHLLGGKFFMELRRLILDQRFDIIHAYGLFSMWFATIILGNRRQTPLFLSFNQNNFKLPPSYISKWLLKRVDYIFTFSKEIEDFVRENFPIPPKKLRNLGAGIEVHSEHKPNEEKTIVGCVVNNLSELRTLHFPIRTFRLLKTSQDEEKFKNVELYIFLGPRLYKKERAKNVLTELDYEFYKGDIHLLSLRNKESLLKDVDVFFGTAFDEPLNDFELASLLNKIPVLFPRTAMRQNLVENFPGIGESYFKGDSREARVKLLKLLVNIQKYRKKLEVYYPEIFNGHGLDYYAERLQQFYEMAFAKRLRIQKKKAFKKVNRR